ncbi:MAG: hypothetical protein GXC73_05620 [Chitinophagaceae bacterium]|nr:hypothetical protein [Chitinophagaceae bacterium]
MYRTWLPFFVLLMDNDEDGLRGFEMQDADGYILYFGRLQKDKRYLLL